jgi:hypothetical protein
MYPASIFAPWRWDGQSEGRKIQIAAAVSPFAGTASSKRSSSGTKSDVRAPAAVQDGEDRASDHFDLRDFKHIWYSVLQAGPA